MSSTKQDMQSSKNFLFPLLPSPVITNVRVIIGFNFGLNIFLVQAGSIRRRLDQNVVMTFRDGVRVYVLVCI